MGNSINSLKTNSSNGRDIRSNHLENNNGSSTSRIPRDDIPRGEEEINPPTNSTEEIAIAYTNLDLEVRRTILYREFCEAKKYEAPRKEKRHPSKDLRHKVNKVTFLPNFD